MKTLKTGLATALMAFSALSLSACQWIEGTPNEPPKASIDRKYTKTPDEVARAATDALADLNMPVQSDQHDALGGQIRATRGNASAEPVTVWYQSADPRTTQVSVAVGSGDRQAAQLIQDQIAQKLGSPASRSVISVGARVDGTYDQPVAQCKAAAEQAMKDLKLDVNRTESHDTWAQVDAREADAFPVTIRMERNEKDKTQVTFTAGTSRSQDTEQVAGRLKAEFERVLMSAK